MNLTDEQLQEKVCGFLGWTEIKDRDLAFGARVLTGIGPDGDLHTLPTITLDLMWEALHPDKPLAEEIKRQAKEFLKLHENRP